MSPAGRKRSGFTLLEILVAATVAVLVVGGALTVVVNALSWHERVRGRQQARAEAARVLDRIAADLAASCRCQDDDVGLAATLNDGVGPSGLWVVATNPQPAGLVSAGGDDVREMRFGVGGTWFRFFSQVPPLGSAEEAVALPRAIAYQLIRRRASGEANPRYWLHRTVVRAGETAGRPGCWESGWDLDPEAPGNYLTSGPGNDGSEPGDPFAIVRPGSEANLLAADMVDFGVRLLETAADGTWHVLFPATPDAREYLAPKSGHYPQAVDLLVRVLTPEGARRLAAFESGSGGSDPGSAWWEIVAANSEVVTRRVHLPGGVR